MFLKFLPRVSILFKKANLGTCKKKIVIKKFKIS